jgi:hypothetical protein
MPPSCLLHASLPLISPSLLESAECFKGAWSDIDEVHTWDSDEQWILIDRSRTAKLVLARSDVSERSQGHKRFRLACPRTGQGLSADKGRESHTRNKSQMTQTDQRSATGAGEAKRR